MSNFSAKNRSLLVMGTGVLILFHVMVLSCFSVWGVGGDVFKQISQNLAALDHFFNLILLFYNGHVLIGNLGHPVHLEHVRAPQGQRVWGECTEVSSKEELLWRHSQDCCTFFLGGGRRRWSCIDFCTCSSHFPGLGESQKLNSTRSC